MVAMSSTGIRRWEIVGTSAAAFLAEAGARVTLIEREGLASQATGAQFRGRAAPVPIQLLAALYR